MSLRVVGDWGEGVQPTPPHLQREWVYITGMGAEYQDSLNNDEITQGGDTLLINESIDRVYLSPEKRILIHDPELKRTINIENKGHNTAVIWNPWQNMTQGMGDMADDGYKTMVCVESTYFAKSLESGITVKPNELFTLSTTISL